ALLPAMIVAAITEAFSIRGALTYAVGGGLVGLACYLGLVPFDPDTLRFEGIVRRHLEIMTGAGIVAGLVYWMIAGRYAGAWGLAVPAIAALVIKLLRPDRPLLMSGRAIIFLLVTLALSAGLLTNLTFKSYWGRPRPVLVTQFDGDLPFVPWWDSRGGCDRNCSFFSGEAATAFWAYAPAALTPPPWRPLAYAAATLFGLITSALRMAFGGHFFTDVTTAGLVTFLVIWLAYGMIYRWQRTRLSDEAIDAALTRFAWPAFRAMRRWRGRDAGPRPAT